MLIYRLISVLYHCNTLTSTNYSGDDQPKLIASFTLNTIMGTRKAWNLKMQ